MTENIVIPDPEKLRKAKETILKGGSQKLHVLADFDRTLTRAFIDGKSVPSLISILRDGNCLTPDYAEKANALYAKYHPIEIDPEVSLKDKKRAMEEWWSVHFDLLIKSGLNKNDLEKVVESGWVQFREGAAEFLDFLHKHGIPLVIISSSGLGGDAIAMYFAKRNKLYDNIHVISNSYEWDKNGNAASVKKPIIHVMNKDETAIRDLPVFNAIRDRKNVMLLGDSLGDIGMTEGFGYDNLIKIGFLNENVKESLEQYKRCYDVVILNDGPMDYINKLLIEIAPEN